MMKHGLNQVECETEGLFMIVAGTETTASVIRSAVIHTMTCPPVYQKLKEEIDPAVKAGKVSKPISIQEAKKLPYLQVKPHQNRILVPGGLTTNTGSRLSSTRQSACARPC